MLCTNGTPRGSVFIQLCLFFFPLLNWFSDIPLWGTSALVLPDSHTRGTEESLLRARVTGLLGNSSVGLLCDDPCWWPAVLSLCPSDEPWVLGGALECLSSISSPALCSGLWRSDLWLSPPAGRPWPPRVLFSEPWGDLLHVQRVLTMSSSPLPAPPWSSWLAESSLQRMEQTQLPAS